MKESKITDEQWQRLPTHFGDMAYEHPEMRHEMLEILDRQKADMVAKALAILDRVPDISPESGDEIK